MSQNTNKPKRYEPFLNQHGGRYIPSMDCPAMREADDGEWVSLSDYAALSTENERLKESNNIKRQVIDRLKSEVLHLGSIADALTEVADEMILRHPADCDISEALESIKKEREI